jgi:hypothetical protein
MACPGVRHRMACGKSAKGEWSNRTPTPLLCKVVLRVSDEGGLSGSGRPSITALLETREYSAGSGSNIPGAVLTPTGPAASMPVALR